MFTTNGYVRTGVGWTEGGVMVNFTTPENVHKFRLGNEANHYGELQFNYHYKNKDSTNLYEMTYMISKYLPFGDKEVAKLPETAQLYGKIKKVANNADVWIGKRYYDRRNIESLDYFWLNSSQNSQIGLGIENYQIKNSGNINLSLIKFKYENHSHSYLADLRYLDISISKYSKLNFLGQYSKKTDKKELGKNVQRGYAIGSWWTHTQKNIIHTSAILFRKGTSIVESPYTGKTAQEYVNNKRIYDFSNSSSLDIVNNFLYDDKRRHAIQASLNYQYKDYGIENVDTNNVILDKKVAKNWLSIGFRYLYYISKHINLALETGNDYMKDNKLGLEGSLQKVTFAPQISWDFGYYSRPVLRPFITYAQWSNDFKGISGVFDFNKKLSNKNKGLSIGLQFETWW